MPYKILIVDDDPVIREVLEYNLSNEGFITESAASAEEATAKLAADHSLILLDIMLGGISGLKFAEALRKRRNQVPIIFLTAKDTENDMLTGFSVGGDDYVSKPFSIKEVTARIKAVLKRQQMREKIQLGDAIIDLDMKEIHIGNDKIENLTKTEFEIFVYLARYPDRIHTRESIIDEIWKDAPYITERTVDVHITRLRKKLGVHSSIISHRVGFGYHINININ
ncbi:MAG: response regulator transcription factor [Dysgonamonadaceae bacterium]|jgi:DNA-binding response OmpR family regulator|nr:response regulator transcription factor [Dysgonamonadaceae bacterium]